MVKKVLLGHGVLSWSGSERRSDRYGSIFLMTDGSTSLTGEDFDYTIDGDALKSVLGQVGSLVAVVRDPRQSTHIGDICRGIYPSTPKVNTKLVLGTGTVFTDGLIVGLTPLDGRENDWLDPKVLYKAHEQLVDLYFKPKKVQPKADQENHGDLFYENFLKAVDLRKKSQSSEDRLTSEIKLFIGSLKKKFRI